MRRLTRLLLLVLAFTCIVNYGLISNSNAATFQHAQEIYNEIVVKNRMVNAPPLKLDFMIEGENAYSNGRIITISPKALALWTDDMMVFVFGHELAHHYRYRNYRPWVNEYGADKLGKIYAQRTKYDVCLGMYLFFRLYANGPSESHPSSVSRYNRIAC